MGAQDTRTTTEYTFPWAGLLVLASAIFVCVTSEFLPTGLLPDLARTFDVSESQVGLLVTIFAGTVVISTAPLSALTRRFPRKPLVLVVLVVFALANLLAALAPTYEVLVVARVLGGLAHGLFWAVVGAYSAYLVPRHHIGRAVAITGGGGTAAFVLGVPLGTALGHAVGWRLAFGVIAAVVVVLMIMVIRFLPPITHGEQLRTGEIPLPMRKDPTVLGVVFLCAIIIVVMAGHNIFYTYIAPYLISVANFGEDSIAVLLFVYGGAGAIGLAISGVISDRYPRAGLTVSVGVVAASVLAIALFPGHGWVVITALIVWGIAFGGAPAILQTRMLHTASARLRDIASAFYTTSFNLAIGGGAFIGGILLDRFGLGILPFVDVSVLIAGIALMIVSDVVLRRQAARRRASGLRPAAS
jgi:predicted MFS family arabinose efflux permease